MSKRRLSNIPVAKATSWVRVPSLIEITLVLAFSTLRFLLGIAAGAAAGEEDDELVVVVEGVKVKPSKSDELKSITSSASSHSTVISASMFISTYLEAHSILCLCVGDLQRNKS